MRPGPYNAFDGLIRLFPLIFKGSEGDLLETSLRGSPPLKGLIRLLKGLIRPCKGLIRPLKCLIQPFKAL